MLLTYVTSLGDGQGCAATPAEGRDPYPGGSNPPGALHPPSRDRGHPCPHSLAGPGTTTRPTYDGPVPAEPRIQGPQCTHFYCVVIPMAVKSHFSHFPPQNVSDASVLSSSLFPSTSPSALTTKFPKPVVFVSRLLAPLAATSATPRTTHPRRRDCARPRAACVSAQL
ncbi:hypothetical protein X777_11490 [Ooceraea biroi]|uniref:Uncharacterized protein n=1 Tax=Ooceraea biroi TaxID=2015173 RepID=A0A026W337_OOCBI|nr:hypothetical protein X777_11490 [Ooceraea biroi]